MREAIASCYFHSPMPSLMRRFRDGYQMVKIPEGGRPKFSIEKRKEPSARILIYHRVNDDNDPFFAATSTRLFEQQMRFISRYYKVVSLSELQRHLASGSPELVLAITFDDGYRDNYENAFPILNCYGLPATIFLATEGIDCCEPLWFERMIDAFQRTRREWFDLELGTPRRFALRTPAERLDANNCTFALLRRLANAERRQWFTRIIEYLDVPSDGRRGKMLTWDQVRKMNAKGIDFGGHTVTHPFVSRLTREELCWEVSECKRRVEAELQAPVRHFAYPNGREEDFAEWNKDVLREAGYESAVTTNWGLNYRSTDPMEMRRGQPWEEHPAVFAWKLDWYHLVND